MFYPMFTDFVCFQFYFRDYVAQPCSQIGTAYISFSIKYSHEMRSSLFLQEILDDVRGEPLIVHHSH